MVRTTLVIFVHGIGYKTPVDYGDFITKELNAHGNRCNSRLYRSINIMWGKGLDAEQSHLCLSIAKAPYTKLKELFINIVSDAVAYQPKSDYVSNVYQELDSLITKALEDSIPGDYDDIWLVGHSLGAVACSNYLWDHREDTNPVNKRISRLIMLGSPYSLFTLRAHDFLPIPPQSYHKDFRILNYYHPSDIISYPVKEIKNHNLSYITDIKIRHGFWKDWGPWSHLHYFTNKTIARSLLDSRP